MPQRPRKTGKTSEWTSEKKNLSYALKASARK
jgi:hypothetical protein